MNRKPIEYISGLAVYLLGALLIAGVIILRLPIFPIQFINWLGQSHNPQYALMYFSLALSAALLMILRWGIEIPKLKMLTSSEKLQPYLSGLPLWALSLFLVGSASGFWTVYPSCQPPMTIIFHISERDEIFHPSQVINVIPGETITVIASSVNEDTTLSCTWEYAGDIFQTLGGQYGCQVSPQFTNQPGVGFITARVSENFCPQSSIFSLQTVVIEP